MTGDKTGFGAVLSGKDGLGGDVAVFQVFELRGTIHSDVAVHDLQLQPPRALDDPLAPDLYRVQFTAQFLTDLDEITIKENDQ